MERKIKYVKRAWSQTKKRMKECHLNMRNEWAEQQQKNQYLSRIQYILLSHLALSSFKLVLPSLLSLHTLAPPLLFLRVTWALGQKIEAQFSSRSSAWQITTMNNLSSRFYYLILNSWLYNARHSSVNAYKRGRDQKITLCDEVVLLSFGRSGATIGLCGETTCIQLEEHKDTCSSKFPTRPGWFCLTCNFFYLEHHSPAMPNSVQQ